ncbi:class II fructose-bisphosphatase [Reichenbachiella agarivorans]|uniref:Fructose-1,6-bisphosphatase n=1 Tax=Reichenbachiella agarivorans TaxID=2979464 RepID=A0ABY6CWT3_9BACT|nr:class II fructose-bisphosphatase [Reichenbachiella agarivorans]UXP33853.1 class II fructose-bisphosphatase [Reichenbachiella agarivorans]
MNDTKDLVEILRHVCAKAAIATIDHIGTADKDAGDQAAVDAMRKAFEGQNLDAVVRVGEGEKDEAPMLYVGEKLGNGEGLAIDIAVDPVEGTRLMAEGKANAITVIAATERDGFWDAGSAYYMDKLVVGAAAKGVIDINLSTQENLTAIANQLRKEVKEIGVYVLDKPRHQGLIAEIKACGAKVYAHEEGDVVGSILALMPDSGIDVLMGIGGAPEAVITAAAVKALGGEMQGKLVPQKDDEKMNLERQGVNLARVYHLDDLVHADWAIFVAAGVTTGALLNGVHVCEDGRVQAECIVIGPEQGEINRSVYQV